MAMPMVAVSPGMEPRDNTRGHPPDEVYQVAWRQNLGKTVK